jgi:hypothetical protein
MKKNTLDEEVRRYYEGEELSKETIERIRSAMAVEQPARGRRRWIWFAAALLLAAVGGTWLQWSSRRTENVADDLARVVARDHNRRLGLSLSCDRNAVIASGIRLPR